MSNAKDIPDYFAFDAAPHFQSDWPAKPAALPQPRNLRIINAFMPMIGDLEALRAEMPQWREQNFNAVYVSPIYRVNHVPHFIDGQWRQNGSPYAMTAGVVNARYTMGRQLDADATRQELLAVHDAARANGLTQFDDFVANHIGKDCAIFDRDQWAAMTDDPIFGLLAQDALAGRIDPNDVFAPADVKRHAVAKDWDDVREVRIDTPEQRDNAVKYFIRPYLQTMRRNAIADDDVDATLNLRVDTPAQLLTNGHDSNVFWRLVAQEIQTIGASKTGRLPQIMFETLGEAAEVYQPILQAFSPEMQRQLFHFSGAMWGVTGGQEAVIAPCEELMRLAYDNRHPLFANHHHHRDVLGGDGQINIIGTHDIEFSPDRGSNVTSYVARHCRDQHQFKQSKKLLEALMLLQTPNYMIVHGEEISFEFQQPHIWTAIDAPAFDFDAIRDPSAVEWSQSLAITHSALHDHNHVEWTEISYDRDNHADHLLMINRPAQGYDGAPALVLINAGDEPARDAAAIIGTIDGLYGKKTGLPAPDDAVLLFVDTASDLTQLNGAIMGQWRAKTQKLAGPAAIHDHIAHAERLRLVA